MMVSYKKIVNLTIYDILALILVYYIPALAHVTPMPLYIIEPFRIIILISFLIIGNKNNSILLSLTLPLFSFLISDHPVVLKMGLISIELVFNVVILDYFIRKKQSRYFSIFASIILSKILYYFLKYLLITSGLLSIPLLSTPIMVQIIIVVGLTASFGLFTNSNVCNND